MGFTTYAAFVPALLDMTVNGVTTYRDEPPNQVSSVHLPLMFPRFPAGENEIAAFNASTALASAACELVIIIEPVRQNLQAVNFAAALALMDALNTALKTAALSLGADRWEYRIEQDVIGDTGYWLLVATVEASG